MSIKPILFNTEMVRAIKEGRKTQTRRIIKDNNVCQSFEPGDILWVRETWTKMPHYVYKADDEHPEFWDFDDRWCPSILMPKDAARIFLRVKDVRVERLHDMDEEAAIAEGFAYSPAGTDSPLERFTTLWDKTVKREDLRKYCYHANPWVWVIEFERCEKPEGWEAYLHG